jgi:hypothetical protein
MLMTRYCARVVLLGTLALMLFPRQAVVGLNLENTAVEGGAFALCMVLLIVAGGERLRRIHRLKAASLVACLPGAAVELIAIAGILEAGQLLVHRHASLGNFLANALAIVAVAAICTASAAFLALPFSPRFGQARVRRLTSLSSLIAGNTTARPCVAAACNGAARSATVPPLRTNAPPLPAIGPPEIARTSLSPYSFSPALSRAISA